MRNIQLYLYCSILWTAWNLFSSDFSNAIISFKFTFSGHNNMAYKPMSFALFHFFKPSSCIFLTLRGLKYWTYVESDVADDAGRVVDGLENVQHASHCQRVTAQLTRTNSNTRYPLYWNIGVARGCSGCSCNPQGGENFFRPNLQEKCVSARAPPPMKRSAPPSQSKSQFVNF